MRSIASILVVCAISLGAYYYFLKRAAPTDGTVATQAISTTGVQMDLTAIAQAERAYFVEHGAYASIADLSSSGALTMERTTRDGYAYSVETAPGGFTVSAHHPPSQVQGVAPMHYPVISVDQSMQVRQTD